MRLLLLGDLSPTSVTAEIFKEKDIETLFTDTLPLFRGNDFCLANLECALTETEEEIKKFGPPLKAPKETAEVLKALGVGCVSLSNNHVFDYGRKGIRDTLAALRENGISYTGFGDNYKDSRKDFVIEKNGERIAIIAVCEHEYSYALENRMGSRPYDEYHTVEDVRKAKESCDRVIVIYHGGKEFCRYPSPRLRKLCQALVRNGADLVLCQHSHCIGCYENYQDGHILYGQGNFHFVKPHDFDGWFTSLGVKYDTKVNKLQFIPMKSLEKGIALAKGEERDEILKAFEERNESLKNGEWQKGWQEFCESAKNYYTSVVSEAYTPEASPLQNNRFAHFLDCEAHCDVWRQLFPTYNLTNCLDEN